MTKQEKENYQLIERYLQKELSSKETEELELRMEQDPEFFKEVRAHMEVHELMIDQGLIDIKKKLREVHEVESGGKGNWWKYISGAALIIVAALLMFFYTFSGKNEKQEQSGIEISQVLKDTASGKPAHHSLTEEHKDKKRRKDNNEPALADTIKSYDDPQKRIKSIDSISTQGNLPSKVTKPQEKLPLKDTGSAQKAVPAGKFDCSQISIAGDIKVMESCEDKPTGSIIINLSSLKGGEKPYRFSISEEEGFTMNSQFGDLSAGDYKVLIKDGNGCVQLLAEANVKSMKCPLDLSFYPERESWKIPLKANANAEIKIINSRTGTLVYSSAINGGYPDSWNGTDNNAGSLPMGSYSFIITYSDGEIIQGNVTILR